MAHGFPPDDPFCNLEGKDGFHVVKVTLGDVVVLSCLAYAGGVPHNLVSSNPEDTSVEIVEIPEATAAHHGAVDRLHLALSGIARYLNTGGSWKELDAAIATMRKVAIGGMIFNGYHLTTSDWTTDGWQHVFVKNDGSTNAALWQEPEIGERGLPIGGWIEATTLEKLLEQQENDQTAWRRAETVPEGPIDLLSISDRRDHDEPTDSSGSANVGLPERDSDGD